MQPCYFVLILVGHQLIKVACDCARDVTRRPQHRSFTSSHALYLFHILLGVAGILVGDKLANPMLHDLRQRYIPSAANGFADTNCLRGRRGFLARLYGQCRLQRGRVCNVLAPAAEGLQVLINRHAIERDGFFYKHSVQRQGTRLSRHTHQKNIGVLVVAQKRKHDVACVCKGTVRAATFGLDARQRGFHVRV